MDDFNIEAVLFDDKHSYSHVFYTHYNEHIIDRSPIGEGIATGRR